MRRRRRARTRARRWSSMFFKVVVTLKFVFLINSGFTKYCVPRVRPRDWRTPNSGSRPSQWRIELGWSGKSSSRANSSDDRLPCCAINPRQIRSFWISCQASSARLIKARISGFAIWRWIVIWTKSSSIEWRCDFELTHCRKRFEELLLIGFMWFRFWIYWFYTFAINHMWRSIDFSLFKNHKSTKDVKVLNFLKNLSLIKTQDKLL